MTTDPSDPHVRGPGTLPTPFTAEEIRSGCPDGRTTRQRVEADGRVVGYRTNVFRDGDADGATTETQEFDADGVPTGPPSVGRTTWLAFQRHASFAADRTTREAVRLETPLGWRDCLHYQRSDPDGSTSDFWFALSSPGLPIRYRTVRDGRVAHEVVVIEDHVAGAPGGGAGRS